jgi:UDP-N-acetylmuramyl pentapeptide phosphotransferase/UDP-N-acetylglucosamine-1-phosphate transferase
MRKAGLKLLVAGLLITLVTGFSFVTKEKILEIGDLEITADKNHSADWSRMAGLAVIAVGGIMIAAGGTEK